MHRRGISHFFMSELLCLLKLEKFVEDSSVFQKTSEFDELYAYEGEITVF